MPRKGRPPFPSILRLHLALLALVMSASAGCGYRNMLASPPDDSSADAGRGTTRVAVLSIRNDSPEPWLDRIVSDSLRREIGLRGRIDLVADPAHADYVLRGRILPLGLRSNSFSTFVVAIEYKVTLQLELEVLRAEGDVIRLPGPSLSESDIYLASQDIEVTRSNRLEALRHLSDVLATRVADSVEWIAFDQAAPEAEIETNTEPSRVPAPEPTPSARGSAPVGDRGMLYGRVGGAR